MKPFPLCSNVLIKGEGLEGAERRQYEAEVETVLDQLYGHQYTARAILNEIQANDPRVVVIQPFKESLAKKRGKCNAHAGPDHNPDSTLNGYVARNGKGEIVRVGTGKGSSCKVFYSPRTFAPESPCLPGPGATPDESLMHELCHAIRFLAGRAHPTPISGNPDMDNFEEFFAILLTNIYRSEAGRKGVRRDHHGHKMLLDETADPKVFQSRYGDYIFSLRIEYEGLFDSFAKSSAPWNPIALWWAMPTA